MGACILLITANGLATISTQAQPQLAGTTPEEVFQGELVFSQERGELQVTLGPAFADTRQRLSSQLPVVLEYGLTDAWQAEIEWTSYSSGLGEDGPHLSIGTQQSFIGMGRGRTHAAIGVEVGVPVGKQETYEMEPFVTFARDLEYLPLQVFSQAVLEWEWGGDEGEDEQAAWRMNMGAFWSEPSIAITTELTWEHQAEGNAWYVTPGIVKALPGAWQVGLGIALGLSDEADTFQLISFLSYEFSIGAERD